MGVVGGVDKVQIVCPLVRQLLTDVPQAGHRHRLSEILMADFLILAEHTAQGAAGEKDGPRSSGAGDRGLLPVVYKNSITKICLFINNIKLRF